MPCPAVPGRPPRSLSNAAAIEASSCPSNGAYAPLDIATREQSGVYEAVTSSSGKKRGMEKQLSGGGAGGGASGNSTGVYQALVEPNKDSPTTYAVSRRVSVSECVSVPVQMVNIKGERGGARGTPPTSPTGGDSMYMGLRQETRQPDTGSKYASPDRK